MSQSHVPTCPVVYPDLAHWHVSQGRFAAEQSWSGAIQPEPNVGHHQPAMVPIVTHVR